MHKQLDTEEFISIIAKRARFTKSDVKAILLEIINLFEECAHDDIVIKLRSLGKLHSINLPERKGVGGRVFPPTRRINFRLAENIRFQNGETSNEEVHSDGI